MSKVKRFSLEERYGYQNRKVIYDKNADNDIELNNIYPIIDLINQLDEQISDLQHRLEVADKALELAVETMRYELGREAIKNLYKDTIKNLKDNLNMKFDTEMCEWFIEQAKEMLGNE